MRPILLESDRHFFQTAEWACVSILAHLGVVWMAVGAGIHGWKLPTTEREARVVFLLPPDRVDVRSRQSEIIELGRLGADFEEGWRVSRQGAGGFPRTLASGSRRRGNHSGARGKLPFGPISPFVPDTVFSVIQVDEMVERYDGTAAPVYPRDLLALGVEGMVQATYVVDTTGRVDTTTIKVVQSDDLRFSESVRTALGQMRFRPAKRAGRSVRQLCEQKFRFRINPTAPAVDRVS
jgi:TonB family protein